MIQNRGKRSEVTLNLPLPVIDVTQATTIVPVVAEAHTLVVGSQTTGSFCLNFGPVASELGDLRGSFNNSSLSFGGTALVTEVSYQSLNQRRTSSTPQVSLTEDVQDLTALLDPGEYYVVYETGRVYYRKNDASVNITATYYYRSASSSGGGVSNVISSSLASTNAVSGTVMATNGAGGTTIISARATRDYAEFTNTGAVVGYFGTGTVDSTFQSIAPGETKAWNGQQELKVLSSGANIDIKFTDYYN